MSLHIFPHEHMLSQKRQRTFFCSFVTLKLSSRGLKREVSKFLRRQQLKGRNSSLSVSSLLVLCHAGGDICRRRGSHREERGSVRRSMQWGCTMLLSLRSTHAQWDSLGVECLYFPGAFSKRSNQMYEEANPRRRSLIRLRRLSNRLLLILMSPHEHMLSQKRQKNILEPNLSL